MSQSESYNPPVFCGEQTTSVPETVAEVHAIADTHHHGFSLSNPKNYLGAPLAVAATGDAGGLIPLHLTTLAREVKLGAAAFDLISRQGEVTSTGHYIVEFARRKYDSVDVAIQSLGELKGANTRFVDARPNWSIPAQTAISTHPLAMSIVETLAEAPRSRYTLPELTIALAKNHAAEAREGLLDINDGKMQVLVEATVDKPSTHPDWLTDTNSFQTQTTYQFKSLFYNAGVLTSPGSDSSRLTPKTDYWELSPRLADSVRTAILGGED